MTDRRRWRCLLIGTEPLLIECAAMLQARDHELAAIVSAQPEVRHWAAGNGVMMFETMQALLDAAPLPIDYLFSITNMLIVPPAVLALARHGAINFHDGPLPAYAGLNTPAWALLNGETTHGISWHRMEASVDTGAVLIEQAIGIDPDETTHSLNIKCFAAAIDSFPDVIAGLEADTLTPGRQPGEATRWFGREDRPLLAGTLDWHTPATTIAATARALTFGGARNPLGCPKLRLGAEVILVEDMTVEPVRSGSPAGTVVRADDESITVATGTTDVRLGRLTTAAGVELTPAEARRRGLIAGLAFDVPSGERADTLNALDRAVALHEPWWRARLGGLIPLRLPLLSIGREPAATPAVADLTLPSGTAGALAAAATIACLGRLADQAEFDIGFVDPLFVSRLDGVAPWFARTLPLRVAVDWNQPLSVLIEAIAAERRRLHRRIGHSADLVARRPELRATDPRLPVTLAIVDRLADAVPVAGAALTIAVRADGRATRWLYDASLVSEAVIHTMQAAFTTLLAGVTATPDRPIGLLPLLDDGALATIAHDWNDTAAPVDQDACLHQLFDRQAARTPDAPAVTCRGVTLSYAELAARARRLAGHLQRLGVGPDMLVGLHLARSVDMLVALIAIHQAGGAYLPLDPAYPAGRLDHMIADSGVSVIVTQASLAGTLPSTPATLVRIDSDWPTIAAGDLVVANPAPSPASLAYVIYTSGSTGLPKGVMVEHRNVANFFAGMDRIVRPGGTWLAVTSLSFDISVLELCWTVARGCHVVIATGDEPVAPPTVAVRPIGFSLFYFASADTGRSAEQYLLLLDGARFADTHGFEAVWTPERHFHAFGGLYPNPAVTAAAIAAITTRVQIRGGSVVAPLHHPIRIAEEWALVDNLSAGRVGIAFASGWQPDDFVLRPESFADKTAALTRSIDAVRGLWRGEKRSFPGALGEPVEIGTFPRPIQAELPFWITSAGNPDTFAAAGKAGAGVLTHLLGQTPDELGAKLRVYRDAWADAGHAGRGRVTLMLHSFVGDDADTIRATVREPLTEYLRTATGLLKGAAWTFPAFKRPDGASTAADVDLAALDAEEMAALLDHAFERYFTTGGLFGTPAHCLALVEQLRSVGVDEIGCLIDFGIPAQQALDHLPHLDALRQLAEAQQDSLSALMQRHAVTHLQCTPSLAQMLVRDPAARACLASLECLLVGGEAFPPALASDVRALVGGDVLNMYGPTEATVWSAAHRVDDEPGAVPLGRPLANQRVFILDSRQEPVPPGLPGELVIAGDGVTRGYLDRPALNAERFVALPFLGGARAYRTGDMARQRPDGTLVFLGRRDHQVKIRGHRVEPGEAEAVLSRHPAVERAIVTAREDVPGDVRLVAYVVVTPGADTSPHALRDDLHAHLPAIMVPAHLMLLDRLPLLPNGKVDRDALPRPGQVTVAATHQARIAPSDPLQERIAAAWREVLGLGSVSTRENFFDLGGHSLLAVQVHRRLRDGLGLPLTLTDIFRFPTIAGLAAHLEQAEGAAPVSAQAQARGAGRQARLRQRLGLRFPAAVGGERA